MYTRHEHTHWRRQQYGRKFEYATPENRDGRTTQTQNALVTRATLTLAKWCATLHRGREQRKSNVFDVLCSQSLKGFPKRTRFYVVHPHNTQRASAHETQHAHAQHEIHTV